MIVRTNGSNKANRQQDSVLFKRILLVENDTVLRDEICDFLDLNFYDVTVATSAAEAIRQLVANRYDVIICDVTMKNFPGDMFYQAIGRIRPELCKRLISVNDATEKTALSRAVGVMNIWKPIDFQLLLETIQTLVGKNDRAAEDTILDIDPW